MFVAVESLDGHTRLASTFTTAAFACYHGRLEDVTTRQAKVRETHNWQSINRYREDRNNGEYLNKRQAHCGGRWWWY